MADERHVGEATERYTPQELMVAAASREINDADTVFVGMRLPMLAFQLAVSTHAQNALALYESGVIRDDPAGTFIHTMCDLANQHGAVATTDMLSVMGRLQRGDVDLGFLGTAEIDRYGNLNTTRVGPADDPIRLPGSGGACDIACLADETVVLMPHEPRRFVNEVAYVTSPGYPDDGSGSAGRPTPGGGPRRLVTSQATFGFDYRGELFLRTVHPGVDEAAIHDDIPWELGTQEEVDGTPVGRTETPSDQELELIREFDPEGFWTS